MAVNGQTVVNPLAVHTTASPPTGGQPPGGGDTLTFLTVAGVAESPATRRATKHVRWPSKSRAGTSTVMPVGAPARQNSQSLSTR